MGRTTRYQVDNFPNGDFLRTNTFADGTASTEFRKATGEILRTEADGSTTSIIKAHDPRFGIQSEYVGQSTVKTPGGLQYQFSQTRQINLVDPKDVLSVTSQAQTTIVNGKSSTTTYDAAQNLWTTTSPGGGVQKIFTDAIGKPSKIQQYGLDDVSYSYNSQGQVTSVAQGSRTASFAYDTFGNVSSQTNAGGKTTNYQHDQAGRVISQQYPNGQSISFSYDLNGNLIGVTPPGRPIHTFDYNNLDGVKSYGPPSLASAGATQYQYNADRQLTQIQRPDGLTIAMNYNLAGQLANVTTPDGITAYTYSPQGQLIRRTKTDGAQIAYAYDAFLPISQTWIGSNTNPISGTVSYVYNNDFLIKEIQVQGNAVSYAYDNDNLLQQAGYLTYLRDTNTGNISGTQLNNVSTNSSYNSVGELIQEQASVMAGTIYNVSYQRDNQGRIIASTEIINGIQDNYAYGYGDLDQLTSVSKNGALVRSYSYDANGNRLGVTTADGNTTLASYDNQDRLLQLGSNTYDHGSNGERKSKSIGTSTTQYVYDVMGNLTQATLPDGTKLDYLIDANNRRLGKKVNGQLVQSFLYENQLRPAAELDNAGNIKSRFVYGVSPNVPDYMEQNGKRYRFIKNHLGSPRLIIDSDNGTIVQRMDYDEWGNVINDTNPGFQPFGFAGGLYDRDTQLTRFGARDYDAEAGRWTAKDPIGFGGGDSSLYSYVRGNPVSRVDPLGLWSFTFGGYLGAGFQVSFGNDNGNGFMTGRVGFGFGGGYSYDPNGGIPGPAIQDRSTGGIVLSDSVAGNFSAGPITGSLEGGVGRNYSNGNSGKFGGPSGTTSSPWWGGIRADGSVGAQCTVYSKRQ
ncbi:RHS repeat-associated core domain-containing protein [Undibacterium sp. RTI2.1]|uniref:RHS repeat-associated core domain-containing protein n=1 Tax=unclassified Undibacterium TaxID=2630295 RepID=UPI002B230A96|nr:MULTISPECIES: RHS repeat-associated core domain-containing protein [unclassified Undibacterium]MEB0033154.1 RHS repeat-associated core domain-containing protein [Undibacterium sp. RTI2.1]MEB0118958.1 RHS repeat-associated core domain-containing protein [Undibacterium sp. RTI2.2]